MIWLLMLILAAVLPMTYFYNENSRYEHLIEEKVKELGGELLTCKLKTYSSNPFYKKGRTPSTLDFIYYFTYEINGEEKEGWVSFKPMEEWIL